MGDTKYTSSSRALLPIRVRFFFQGFQRARASARPSSAGVRFAAAAAAAAAAVNNRKPTLATELYICIIIILYPVYGNL